MIYIFIKFICCDKKRVNLRYNNKACLFMEIS